MTYNEEVIECCTIVLLKIHLYQNKKIVGEFRHAFSIVGKPSMRRFNEGDLGKNYTWGVRDIKCLVISVNGNSNKLQKMNFKGKISWVTSSHLGQGHKLH